MATLLISGKTIVFDDADAEALEPWRWYLHVSGGNFYVRGSAKGGGTARKYMHRILMGEPSGMDVDHINGNGLDNRRSNLRVCTRSENNANRHRVQSRSSPHKGVHLDRHTGRWRAEVHWQGKRYTLGRYADIEAAREAYAIKARELFGEFANPV